MADNGFAYRPDYAVPPGETLLDVLNAVGMTQKELALRMGRPPKTVNEIIKGKAAITTETTLQLERVLGTPASFWGNRERQYRETLARLTEEAALTSALVLVDDFPVAQMVKRGWLAPHKAKSDTLRSLLTFFGVGSPEQLGDYAKIRGYAFREAARGKRFGARLAWLRQGEILGQEMDCAPYDPEALKAALAYARTLTHLQPVAFWEPLQERMAGAGVASVFISAFPRMGLHGATRWLTKDKALLLLSSHYKTNDQFWFSFFHEAAHILLHGKRSIFLETGESKEREEEEANRWAAELLLPARAYRGFCAGGRLSRGRIKSFAREVGVAPAVVLARLQRKKRLPYQTRFNDFKMRLEWPTDTERVGSLRK